MSVTGSFQRPLLAIVDRHVDISTMLHHTWTYQALAHDLLEYKLNRVGYDDTDTKGEVRGRCCACGVCVSICAWLLLCVRVCMYICLCVSECSCVRIYIYLTFGPTRRGRTDGDGEA